jgi:dipeptidyl aminopeptidase/acylaminoacyl peptidase
MTRLCFAAIVCAGLALSAPAGGETERRHPATLEDVFLLRDIGGDVDPFLEISPDGRQAAFFVREILPEADNYTYRLALTDIASGETRLIADAGGFVFRSDGGYRSGLGVDRIARFSPDGAALYFTAERDGRLNIHRLDLSTGAQEQVTDAAGDVRTFSFRDGQLLFETATPRETVRAQLAEDAARGFRVDENFRAANGLTRVIDETAGARHWSYNPATGQVREMGDIAQGGESDERALIRALDSASEVAEPALGLFAATERGEVQCTDAVCAGSLESAWPVSGANAEEIVFLRREGHGRGLHALYGWSLASGAVRSIRRAEERLSACALSGERLICFQESTLQPRRLVAVDLSSGVLTSLYDPNPRWSAIAAPRIERLDFTDREGNESYAHLVYPLNYRRGRSYPAVIVQYRSRGFLRGGVGNETPILPLSARGYFVISVERPEFRHRGARLTPAELQRETELDGSERGAKREAINAFLAAAFARGVDRERVGITGLSDGAETLYAMLMDEPSAFSAAVAGSPPTDPASWPLQASAYRDRSLARLGLTSPWVEGSPWTQWWRDNSASLNADRLRTPILFNWGESEAIRGFPLLARLHENGTPHEAYIYPGAYHLKYRPQQLLAVQQRTIAWFDRWLQSD